jgi:hypothetical protein
MSARLASEDYPQQLTRVSAALAAAKSEAILADIMPICGLGDVQRFIDNAVGERFRLISEELAFVALAFEGFDRLIDQYLRENPRQTYALDHSDQERFLGWLRSTYVLDAKQSDFIAHQEAEYACLAKAQKNREGHVAFQRLWTLSKQTQREQQEQTNQEMQVNPIHVWSRMTIANVQSIQSSEANVLFLAVGQEVRSLWLDREQIAAVRDLTQHNSITLADWSARHPELTNPTQLCDDLVAAGLVAVTET